MVKQLDASSAPEEMVQAAKSLQLARAVGIVAGLAVAAIAFFVIGSSSLGGSPLAIVVLILVAAGAYRLAYEILARTLPPN